MTPDALAALSARAYRYMAPWSAQAFADTLTRPTSLLKTSDHAFVLGQVVADEAEILALAADPAHQRQGEATTALQAFHKAASARGAQKVFLEVSAENAPAIRFYQSHGYSERGRRKAYYRLQVGQTADALIMARDLP
ncbi:MAG: GNAT family N-acetyltransferase [Paracoccaceae bacterium]|nr:GNAT family N-acetyltransferase [Paracoccaceae bacterium]